MRITDEQKERAAFVNLPQFLMAHGFDLKKVGREYVWKDHDSLHIKDNGPGERGAWFRFSEDGKISDRTFYYGENLRHTMDMSYGDDGITCSFSGMERFVSFEEIGQAFIDRIHEEYEDLTSLTALSRICRQS